MRSRRAAMGLVGVLWGALLLRMALIWDQLPPVLASHFGPSGRADGWTSRATFVFLILLLEGGTTLLMLLAPRWMKWLPKEAINLPHREYWLAEERRSGTLETVGVWMAWLAAALSALFLATNELVIRANLSRQPLDNRAFWVVLGGFLAVVAVWLRLFSRSFRAPRPDSPA